MAENEQKHERTWLEWLSGAIGLLITLGLLGFIGWQALGSSHAPPALELEVTDVAPAAGGFVVEFTAHNRSDSTASAVEVEGTLRGSAPQPVVSRTTLDYVPARSRAEGGLYFSSDPRKGSLEVRALGYAAP